ncbi:MAG: hypothetical protein R3C05_24345 [Pirellulaceae bacterium]
MRTLVCFILPLIGWMAFSTKGLAQTSAADSVDRIEQQAAALEAELGKYRDASPEAGEVLVQLVDLYYGDGRLFGLVRASQLFVSSHGNDPRHQAIMLKLIDGQEALSRNQELASTIRQFLARYPNAAENAELEIRLAESLCQLDDRVKAAEACRAVWTRQGPNAIGRTFGARAMQLFDQANNQDAFLEEGQLGEEMLDKLPRGEFAKQVGLQAFHSYRRIGQWAKSSSVGNKLIQKQLVGDREALRQLHIHVAENHANLGQHANAAESYQRAREIRDDQAIHYQVLMRTHLAGAPPTKLEPLMREYGQKYPQRRDRYHGVSYLALSYIANGDKARGRQLLSMLLGEDPLTNNNARVYVRESETEPAALAETEAKLRQAIRSNKEDAYYLRHVLALDLYRDRMKDVPKAKQVVRELIQQSPSDDYHTTSAVDWLLHGSDDDKEFANDLRLILSARQSYPHFVQLRDSVGNWIQRARQNKDLASRVSLATEELKKADSDPLLTLFVDQKNNRHAPGAAIRAKLLQPEWFKQLNDSAARYVLQTQAEWFRHYAPGNQRSETINVYKQFAEKFPLDRSVAWDWLQTATDFGKAEDSLPAAKHWLKFPPESSYGDHWRRLLIATERGNDQKLAREIWTWMNKAQQMFGRDAQSAAGIGDMLLKLNMETEAVEHWTVYAKAFPQSHEARECKSLALAIDGATATD